MFKQRKDWLIAFFFCCITGTYAGTYIPQKSNRINIPLDTGWLFNKSDNASFSGGTAFNDANWTAVCLPHSNVITKHAYLDTASFRIITWYRRHFTAPVSYNNRRFLLEFQAVATVATVYVNGSMVGTPHKGAYTPFTLDITEKIKFGQDNVIAVKVDSKRHIEIPPEVSSRLNMDFMVFGGIVRPVTMIITDPVYVDWTFVSTQNPSQTAPINPTVQVKTQVINKNSTQRTCTITTSIVDNTNTVVAQASSQAIIPAGGSKIVDQTTSAISNPHLWDIDDPYLYSVYIQIHDEGGCVDE